MSGTREGGLAASKLNKERYGEDFYKMIGRKGGQLSGGGGFAKDPELARQAGLKGITKSIETRKRRAAERRAAVGLPPDASPSKLYDRRRAARMQARAGGRFVKVSLQEGLGGPPPTPVAEIVREMSWPTLVLWVLISIAAIFGGFYAGTLT